MTESLPPSPPGSILRAAHGRAVERPVSKDRQQLLVDSLRRLVRRGARPHLRRILEKSRPEDLAVTEAVEAVQSMRAKDLPVTCAVVNGVRTSPFGAAEVDALRAVAGRPGAPDADKAAALAALAVADGAVHDAREVAGLGRDAGIPVAVLPVVPDLSPASGGLEALSAALMSDPAIGGGDGG